MGLLSLSPLLVAGGADLQLLVPLYSYPSWYEPKNYVWARVAAAAGQVPVTAVINPNNGPDGGPPNADYQAGLNDLRSADVTILGYVYITDDTLPNPWDTLPTYWEDEVSYIRALRELRITSLTLSGTDAHIAFTTVTNASFAVERATCLTTNGWTALTNGVQGTGDTVVVVDPEAGARSTQFYRTALEL